MGLTIGCSVYEVGGEATTSMNATSTTGSGDGAETTTGASATDSMSPTSGSASGSTTGPGTDSGTDTSPATTGAAEMTGDSEACAANGDCMSLGCEKYRDAEEGTCAPAPASSATRFTGTLLDFATNAPIPGVELRVIGVLSALGDPANATPVAKGTADAMGKVDFVSADALKEGIGVVGIVGAGKYYTSATGLASQTAGKYGPMNSIRDIWGVPTAKLTEWTGLLMADADAMPFLPLGDAGGVIGLVRDAATSVPKPGAKVLPVNDNSNALVRYLSDDGLSFNSNATGTSGIFILVNPGLAEQFTVEGSPDVSGAAGSAKGAAFVMILGV